MKNLTSDNNIGEWPEKPNVFPELMTPVEAAMFLRTDQTGRTPEVGADLEISVGWN